MVQKFDNIPAEFFSLVVKSMEMTNNSYAPYSGFNVGAAVLLSDGRVVTGCNQENAAFGECICAERVALLSATANFPANKPVAIAISAFTKGSFTNEPVTPCGSCREVIAEMERRFSSPIKIIMYGVDYVMVADSVIDLLPFCFGFQK